MSRQSQRITGNKWLLEFFSWNQKSILHFRVIGFLSFDVNITSKDINQCEELNDSSQIKAFLQTHKCHQESSEVK